MPTSVLLAVLVQTAFLIALAATDAYDAARSGEVARVVFTYVTIVALFGVSHVAFRQTGSFVVYSAFVLVNFARYETTGSFDYTFAHENVRELMTPLGRHIVGAQVRPVDLFFFLVLPWALGLLIFRRRAASAPTSRSSRGIFALASAAVILFLPLAHVSTHEALTTFVAAGIRFHAHESSAVASTSGDEYPLARTFAPSDRARSLAGSDKPRPHVILLFLESWSGIYDGRTTPVFEAHRRDGLSFDQFYGSSVQSSRGRFATLCSVIPVMRGKEYQYLSNATLRCLPRMLGDAGYATLLESANDEPTFERQADFFSHMGFEDVRFEDPNTRAHEPMMWGAGLQDDVYYEKLFRTIDEKIAADPKRPLFVTAINASNHYPFSKDPKHVPEAGLATKYARNYVAGLRAQDARLATFFAELDKRPALNDAIVVLVGDHSFPADEHGIHFNGLGAYEESFRTAFLLRWRGHVPEERIKERAASQIDLAPTIADLLQLEGPSHFVGRSLVADTSANVAAPMVQPYDGIRLVAVRYPWKLESHEAAEQEHLYNLANDPREEHDRAGDPTLVNEIKELRATIAQIRESDAVVRAARVFPSDQSRSR